MKKNKKCTKCKRELPISSFNWRIKNVKKSSHCKECSRKYVRNHYKNNKKYYLKKAQKRNLIQQQKTQGVIGEYLQNHPCIDCGENNILVLEFDHINRKNKKDAIANIARRRLSLKTLKKEIKKCEVRCANCHRIKTAIESNSWKLKYAPVA